MFRVEPGGESLEAIPLKTREGEEKKRGGPKEEEEEKGGLGGDLGLPAVNTAAQDQGSSDSIDSTLFLKGVGVS